MSDHIKEKVTWFLKNLDWQLEDVAHEKNKNTVEIYFDTSDVRKAVLGMQAYYTPEHGFQVDDFFHEDEKVLVCSLMSSGWLGPFKMLPPHQAEFLTLLNLDFGVGVESDPRARAREFLREVTVTRTIAIERTSIDEDLLGYVRERAGPAMNLFKAIQCIGGTWQTRLVKWRQAKLLGMNSRKIDYSSIVNSEAFARVRQAFENRRPSRHVVNVADAVAVCTLINSVREFNDGKSTHIPRFFVSSHLFRDAVKEAGVESSLEYKSYRGKVTSVLRDVDYFIFKSTFRPPRAVLSAAGKESSFFLESVDLEKLRDQVDQILQAQKPLTEDTVNKIDVSGRPLGEVIEDFRMASFLDNVWLPFSAEGYVRIALGELGEAASQLEGRRLEGGVEKAISATKRALEQNVREYKRVSSLWLNLESSSEGLRNRVRKEKEAAINVFRDLGLLRFGFPKSAHNRITEILETFLAGDDKARGEARSLAIASYYAGREDPARDRDSLVLATAVLWAAEMDKQLIELLDRINRLPHYSLQMALAAAMFRIRHKLEKGRQILTHLQEQYGAARTTDERADLAVGIAYLFFHLWVRLGFSPNWRPRAELSRPEDAEGEMLVGYAIKYAKDACSHLSGEESLTKKVYALNQYLYYLIEGGSDEMKPEMLQAARDLIAYKNTTELWQYRYDDTLARYFHRMAVSTENVESWQDLMKEAKRHIEVASQGSVADHETESYRSILMVEMATGFHSR